MLLRMRLFVNQHSMKAGKEGRKDVMPRHFGILIPSTNTTCEIEFCRLPSELQVHTGRLGKGGNTPFSPSIGADLAHPAELPGQAPGAGVPPAPTPPRLF